MSITKIREVFSLPNVHYAFFSYLYLLKTIKEDWKKLRIVLLLWHIIPIFANEYTETISVNPK